MPDRLCIRLQVHLLDHASVDVNGGIVVERGQLGQDRESSKGYGQRVGVVQLGKEE
jgi:hypothetical protein